MLQSIRKLKAAISVLVGDDRKIIEMIKDAYLKESTLPDDSEANEHQKRVQHPVFHFADFDERKMLRASRLGMYFRQSLVGMVAY